MSQRTRARGFQSWRLLAVALYALFLVAAPFEHHDLWCELKTPQHCTSCVSSQLGSDPHATIAPTVWHLADAGRADSPQIFQHSVLLVVTTPGRSPPIVL
jgi:hypothetical protein